ncbi:hypothetical protein ACNJC6_03169 [Acinetobacter johnsonii]|uniref:Uncharacterized protein n=1 Tax=Acinetobacter johnsonii TaxID=40214 RepID=A0A1R7QGW4_ACIJO|nr:hypothetical protein ACNJC6_03169 [Acinetobacter johnsonii]
MSRTALTTQDHINSIEYFAMNNATFESSHYDVIQLIEQKKLGELSDKEKQLIRKTYLYTKKERRMIINFFLYLKKIQNRSQK